jgi:mono/diheme cytochrome c family protein
MCAMQRMRIGVSFVVVLAAFYGVEIARARSSAGPKAALPVKLRAQRSTPSDLELNGDLAGVPPGESRYLTREDLLAISRPMTISPDDGNFKTPSEVKAVALDDLAHALGVPSSDMVIAICKDKYRGHYPGAYLSAHHPVLVMELDGKPLPGSPETEADDPGPYLIAHANFKPAFKILAHEDEAQIPWGVIRLEFHDEKSVFGAIAPRDGFRMDPDIESGFQIAAQNCFRCHNSGDEGGQKSGVSWEVLGTVAATSLEFFTDYVRNPKSKNPRAQMPGNPEYDEVTLRALFRYFGKFAPTEAH